MALTVGTVFLQVSPSLEGFGTAIDAAATEAGDSAGEAFGEAFNAAVSESTKSPNFGPSDSDSTEKGSSSGGKFADGFQARVDAALKSLPDVKIDADSSDADRKIADVRAELEALTNQKVGIDISDVDALAKLAAVKAALVEVGTSSPNIQVRVDAAAAVAELGAVDIASVIAGGALDELSNGAAKEAQTAFNATQTDASNLSQVFEALPDAVTPASAGIALLATALIPIAGVATGAGIALTGAFAAGLAGIGAFALAAAGDFGQFTDTLKSDVSAWQSQFQGLVQPVVNSLTNEIAPALSALSPLVASAANEINESIKSIGDGLQSGGFHDFISFLADQAPSAIGTFTIAVENIGKGFASVLEAFAPFISTIELGIVNLSGKFADLGNSSGLKSFVNYVQQEAPVVGAFFEALAPSIGKIISALAPLGDGVLRILTPIIQDIGNMAPIIQLAAGAFDALARIIQLALTPLEKFSSLLGDLGRDIGGFLGAIGSFLGLTGTAANNTNALASALEHAGLSTQQAKADIEQYGSTFISQIGAANFAADQFGQKVGLTGQQFKSLEQASGEAGSKLVSDLQAAATQSGLTASALGQAALTTGQSFQSIAKAVTQAASSTQSSFNSATSVVSAFGGQVGVTQTQVGEFYGNAVAGAQGFANNIQAAIKEGYDPALIEQILEAGPQQAAGLLGELVQDGSQAYVAQINAAQQSLSQIGQEAVEESRLTEFAIKQNTDQASSDLAGALAVDQAKFAVTAGEAPATAVAALSAAYPNYVAIAKEFGITLPQSFADSAAQTQANAEAQAAAGVAGTTSQSATAAAAAQNQANTLPGQYAAAQAAAESAAAQQAAQAVAGVESQQGSAIQTANALSATLPDAALDAVAPTNSAAINQAAAAVAGVASQQTPAVQTANAMSAALPGALNDQTPPANSAAINQAAQAVAGLTTGQGPAENTANAMSAALPGALNGQVGPTNSAASNQAGQVPAGINSQQFNAIGAAGALASAAYNNMAINGTFDIGSGAAAAVADGIRSQIGNIEAAAAAATAAAAGGFGGIPIPTQTGHNAAGTGLGTFQGLTWVGEQGPELVNFGSPVQIINNADSLRALGNASNLPSGGGGNNVYAPTINAPNSTSDVIPTIRAMLDDDWRRFTNEFKARVPQP